jgi:RNA polymerase sigma-70 factor (ECF subfamily)
MLKLRRKKKYLSSNYVTISETLSDLEMSIILSSGTDDQKSIIYNAISFKYYDMVFSYGISVSKDEDTSADITAKTFSKFIRHGEKSYSHISSSKTPSFLPFLYKIFIDLYKNEYTRRKRYFQTFQHDQNDPLQEHDVENYLSDGIDHNTPELIVLKKEKNNKIRQILNMLSVDQKEMLILKYLDGLKETEISELKSMPVNTVKVRLFRARNEFKRLWEIMSWGEE